MRRNLATSIKVNVMLLCILGMIFSVLLVAHYLTNVFILLGVSLIVTYLLLEPVEVLQKLLHRFFPKRLSARLLRREPSLSFYRALSVVIVYLFIFLVITVLLVRVVPSLSRQVQGFAGDFPRYIQQLEQRLQDLAPPNSQSNSIAKIAAHPVNPSPANTPADMASDIDPEQTGEYLTQTALGQAMAFIKDYSANMLSYLLNIGASTLTGLVYLLTGLVVVFYFLLDGPALKKGFIQLLPRRMEQEADTLLQQVHEVFYSFIKSQVILSFLAGVYLWLLYSLFGLKYAMLLGFLYGVFSLIPVLGPWLGIIPGAVMVLFNSDSTQILIPLLVLTGLFHIVKLYWMVPVMLKNHGTLQPVVFILTLLICVKTFDFQGLLLAFPLSSVVMGILFYLRNRNNPPLPNTQAVSD